jgi:hypothetical protein
MKSSLIFFLCMTASILMAQLENTGVVPSVTTVVIDGDAVTVLHLSPGYASSVRLPEEINSVVVGNPAGFKAEHSESEPRLVFFKPITTQASESNALITTKSGQEVNLHLVSLGKSVAHSRVDFLLEYRPQQSFLIDSDRQSFLIADTQPVSATTSSSHVERPDPLTQELERQRLLSSPKWEGRDVLVALGASLQRDQQMIVGFSVLNSSKGAIELLPPQIELSGTAKERKGNAIKAEPIPISDYRLTVRRLAPGQRADGIVVFSRPAFKESGEKLQLRLSQAQQVDRPILLPVPFTAERKMQ